VTWKPPALIVARRLASVPAVAVVHADGTCAALQLASGGKISYYVLMRVAERRRVAVASEPVRNSDHFQAHPLPPGAACPVSGSVCSPVGSLASGWSASKPNGPKGQDLNERPKTNDAQSQTGPGRETQPKARNRTNSKRETERTQSAKPNEPKEWRQSMACLVAQASEPERVGPSVSSGDKRQ
jgi:hypothetical protein